MSQSEERRRQGRANTRFSGEEMDLLYAARVHLERMGQPQRMSDPALVRLLALDKAAELVGDAPVPARRVRTAPVVILDERDRKVIREATAQINKLGSNVNQIAKVANTFGTLLEQEEVDRIVYAVEQLSWALIALQGITQGEDLLAAQEDALNELEALADERAARGEAYDRDASDDAPEAAP